MAFREIKRHLNKPDETYTCQLIRRDDQKVALRYVSKRDWAVAGTLLPKGSVTDALYMEGEGFVVWRMGTPEGCIKGHLFHICSDLQVSTEQVTYLDLLLDIWVDRQGNTAVLDRDEVAACQRAGMLSAAQDREILRQERRILAHWPEYVAVLQTFCPAD